MLIEQYNNTKIGILGLGRSGVSVFKALQYNCAFIVCDDDNEDKRIEFAQEFGGEFVVNINDDSWQNLNKIIISPGIPRSHEIFDIAEKNKITISSDIELFLQNNPESDFVLITGTNGKTTTTSLIGHILKDSGKNYIVGGNIGIPVFDLPQRQKGYILELSSFQLDLLGAINPKISVLLNVTPDHLDRHGTIEEYVRVKKKILNINSLKIISIDSEISREIYSSYKRVDGGKVVGISSEQRDMHDVVSCNDFHIKDNFFDKLEHKIAKESSDKSSLIGSHNQQNIATSYAVCRALGLDATEILHGIVSFKGLKHRLQLVLRDKNINFYNDSKATNTESCRASLSSLQDIFWLAGGVFKEEELVLGKELQNIKKAYIFGRDHKIFEEYLSGKLSDKLPCVVEYEVFDTMSDAFNKAYDDAIKFEKNCNLLLAPACSSFDQFKNFEERGDKFISICNNKTSKNIS